MDATYTDNSDIIVNKFKCQRTQLSTVNANTNSAMLPRDSSSPMSNITAVADTCRDDIVASDDVLHIDGINDPRDDTAITVDVVKPTSNESTTDEEGVVDPMDISNNSRRSYVQCVVDPSRSPQLQKPRRREGRIQSLSMTSTLVSKSSFFMNTANDDGEQPMSKSFDALDRTFAGVRDESPTEEDPVGKSSKPKVQFHKVSWKIGESAIDTVTPDTNQSTQQKAVRFQNDSADDSMEVKPKKAVRFSEYREDSTETREGLDKKGGDYSGLSFYKPYTATHKFGESFPCHGLSFYKKHPNTIQLASSASHLSRGLSFYKHGNEKVISELQESADKQSVLQSYGLSFYKPRNTNHIEKNSECDNDEEATTSRGIDLERGADDMRLSFYNPKGLTITPKEKPDAKAELYKFDCTFTCTREHLMKHAVLMVFVAIYTLFMWYLFSLEGKDER